MEGEPAKHAGDGSGEEQKGHESNPGKPNKGGEGHPLTRLVRALARNSWWTRCWMDGIATAQVEPPCRSGRSRIWRKNATAGLGAVSECLCVDEVLCYFVFERRLLNFVLIHCILFDLLGRQNSRKFVRITYVQLTKSHGDPVVDLGFENDGRTSYCTKWKVQYRLEIVSVFRCLTA